MKQNKETNQFIKIKEVSQLLNLSTPYVYELVAQRKIPFYKPFGKILMFKKDEILQIIENSKVSKIN
tara:strand:- start:254 stop:454 length:201 start_codon:yes stop_codon:yes gene_type:complete